MVEVVGIEEVDVAGEGGELRCDWLRRSVVRAAPDGQRSTVC
ncbi:Putative uncharacterized protein [Propionibacterium freudenreichii subsp. freudenreichii]|nr:Putative uncharacterized protein [Propionibacterium freudenreichii subsp. freudenreichii]